MIYEDLVIEKPVKVLIIDNVEEEVRSIKEKLQDKEIAYEFKLVDLANQKNVYKPLETVELVFLDLDYSSGYLSPVQPELCVEQIGQSIAEGQIYYLVAWTKDPTELQGVVDALKKANLTPVTSVAMEKVLYRTGVYNYNIDRLFNDINSKFKQTESVQEFLGRIIEIEEESLLINCISIDDSETYEVRRFDLLPFQEHIELTTGTILKIRVTTRPGSRSYEFLPESSEKAKLFIKPDDFEDLDDLSFLNS